MRVVVATRNQGKAAEFARLLGRDFQMEALDTSVDLPEETGANFAENAELKASAVFTRLRGRRAVLADDSGLEVPALGGAPGVRSARYAGEGAGDEANYRRLLADLEGSPDRSARFVCHLVLLVPPVSGWSEGEMVQVTGYLEGEVTEAPRGQGGFGYDPVFRPRGWERTLAEAGGEEKDRVSHRGAAAAALLVRLRERGLLEAPL